MKHYIDIRTNYRPHQKSPYEVFVGHKIEQTSQNQFTICCEAKEIESLKKRARRNHFTVLHTYTETSHRSTDYRYEFFRTHKKDKYGMYRCRYCNRHLAPYQVEVDHVYPVRMAKTKAGQRYLRRHDLRDVNDVSNLVASCKRCNRRKGSKTGLWLLRAWIGQYKWYWIIQNILLFILVSIPWIYIIWILFK